MVQVLRKMLNLTEIFFKINLVSKTVSKIDGLIHFSISNPIRPPIHSGEGGTFIFREEESFSRKQKRNGVNRNICGDTGSQVNREPCCEDLQTKNVGEIEEIPSSSKCEVLYDVIANTHTCIFAYVRMLRILNETRVRFAPCNDKRQIISY